jgi:clan AA aspartic protease
MIHGIVSQNLEAVIQLQLRGPLGALDVQAVIDTGFNGSISIPESIAHQLGLSRLALMNAYLADGTDVSYGAYPVEVEWDGTSRILLASAIGDECLVGMTLLHGCDLHIRVEAGGQVQVST